MQLTSSAFEHNGLIPACYTCNGVNMSPPLAWNNAPEGTESFVLICDDPDVPKTAPVGIWDHWILYNIPAKTCSLGENIQTLPEGTQEGLNTWGETGYGGPCPPDREHRYFFKLYALDTTLRFTQTPRKEDIEQAMKGHVLAETVLIGRYNQPHNEGS
jgi:Raf kinase inhibitor-like YbhB/YbcL family protein